MRATVITAESPKALPRTTKAEIANNWEHFPQAKTQLGVYSARTPFGLIITRSTQYVSRLHRLTWHVMFGKIARVTRAVIMECMETITTLITNRLRMVGSTIPSLKRKWRASKVFANTLAPTIASHSMKMPCNLQSKMTIPRRRVHMSSVN
jgi:hypothetical protein